MYGCTTWSPAKKKKQEEKARWQIQKSAVLRTLLKKTWTQHTQKQVAVRPLVSHLSNHDGKTKTCAGQCWKSKNKFISEVLLWTPTHGQANAGQPVKTHTHTHIYVCIYYLLESLPIFAPTRRAVILVFITVQVI